MPSDDEYDPLAVTQSVILPVGLSGGRQSVQSEKASSPFPEVENERFSPSPAGSQHQNDTVMEQGLLEVEQSVQSRSATYDISQDDSGMFGAVSDQQDEPRAEIDHEQHLDQQENDASMLANAEEVMNEIDESEVDHEAMPPSQSLDVNMHRESDEIGGNNLISEASNTAVDSETRNDSSLAAVPTSDLNVISPTPTQNNNSPGSPVAPIDGDQSAHLSVPAMGAIGSLVGGSAGALGYALTRRPGSSENGSQVFQDRVAPADGQPEANSDADDKRDTTDDQEAGSWFSRARQEIKAVFTGSDEHQTASTVEHHSQAAEVQEEHVESGNWLSRAKNEVKGVLFGDDVDNEQTPHEEDISQKSEQEYQDSGIGIQNSSSDPRPEDEQSESWLSKARNEIKDVFTIGGKDEQNEGNVGDQMTSKQDNDTEQEANENENAEQSIQEQGNSGSWFSRAKDEVKGVFFGDADDKEQASGSGSNDIHPGSQHGQKAQQGDDTLSQEADKSEDEKEADEDKKQSGSWFSRARDELKNNFQDLKKDVKDTFTFPG